eukprot:1946737-Lingulodinium_polyedra.AAC.1
MDRSKDWLLFEDPAVVQCRESAVFYARARLSSWTGVAGGFHKLLATQAQVLPAAATVTPHLL